MVGSHEGVVIVQNAYESFFLLYVNAKNLNLTLVDLKNNMSKKNPLRLSPTRRRCHFIPK